MSDIKIINQVISRLNEDRPFDLEETKTGPKVVDLSLSFDVLDHISGEVINRDRELGRFLIDRLDSTEIPLCLRQAAVKAAKLLRMKRLSAYDSRLYPEVANISKKILHHEAVEKVAGKLNLPVEVLLRDPTLVKFIKKNHLHNRIDSTYQERGYGPRVEGNQVLFPVNLGSSYNDQVVRWVPHTGIETSAGKVKWVYGPFGFEKGRLDLDFAH